MCTTLIVVDEPRDWPASSEFTVVAANSYLNGTGPGSERTTSVVNLCRDCRYQRLGYYVSLLAEARGHRPCPAAALLEDFASPPLLHMLCRTLSAPLEQALATLATDRLELAVYFGHDPEQRHERLAGQLFALLPAPLLHACFERTHRRWQTRSLRMPDITELPARHRAFAWAAAQHHFHGQPRHEGKNALCSLRLAILHNPQGMDMPSNVEALHKFSAAATSLGIQVQFITPNDIERVPEFDALFIRDTTYAHHYTYHFARYAQSAGLVVIDDPDSIVKCNNKVYLAELLVRHGLPVPRTLLVRRDNIDRIIPLLALPCVLKEPDSSFSAGVEKVDSKPALYAVAARLLAKSELIVAQEWLHTEFDWRVGILDRRVLFACKYYMAPGHWQIINHRREDGYREGRTEPVDVERTPAEVRQIALQAANLIGDGLYGVDIKQIGKRFYIIEVNDNPNIDAGQEDALLQGALYHDVMALFRRRIMQRNAMRRPYGR